MVKFMKIEADSAKIRQIVRNFAHFGIVENDKGFTISEDLSSFFDNAAESGLKAAEDVNDFDPLRNRTDAWENPSLDGVDDYGRQIYKDSR